MPKDNKYVQIGGFNVWYGGNSQINLQLAQRDDNLPGNHTLWITVKASDKLNYDKLAWALRKNGKPAPE